VTTTGRVQVLARECVRAGHVDVEGLDIVAADARAASERSQAYGVNVLQGAFTLWNMQADRDVAISADLAGITAGRSGAPVRGGGIFVSGSGDNGGRLFVRRLETGTVHSDGGIPAGTPDLISGGVFVVFGAVADSVDVLAVMADAERETTARGGAPPQNFLKHSPKLNICTLPHSTTLLLPS
jgi:hypothetical protein